MAFGRRRPALVLLALASFGLLSCSDPTPPTTPTAPGRAFDAPILGVGPALECVEPVVRRKQATPVLGLTVTGQPGDVFDYRVERRDGTSVDGTSDPFGPAQNSAILSTGVPNADIAKVTIRASGTTGVGGTCVISTFG